MSNVGTAVKATEEETVTEYHPLAYTFSEAIEQLGFSHVDTEVIDGESVETWDKETDTGSTHVSIGYTTGKVIADKYDANGRLIRGARFTITLRTKVDMRTAAIHLL